MNDQPTPQPPVYLTVAQIAEAMQLHPMTIYMLVEKRGMPHLRLGRTIRFRLEEVEQWMRDSRKGGSK